MFSMMVAHFVAFCFYQRANAGCLRMNLTEPKIKHGKSMS